VYRETVTVLWLADLGFETVCNHLGIAQRSLVGAFLSYERDPAPYLGDTFHCVLRWRAFCLHCQRIVTLTNDDACAVCGATGTLIMQPVAPRIISATAPLFFA
jgi:hypothetical protein